MCKEKEKTRAWWEHDWEEIEVKLLDNPKRKCKICGAEQHFTQDHIMGRPVGIKKWFPKMSRKCRKAIK